MLVLTAETRHLTLHPLAIHQFIKAQAGSLDKAVAEAVMNSVDANATRVDIELKARTLVISDDGQGFQNKEEIAAWFETLGFPHDEGNHRQFGVYGMGRAQMWAYASTVWHTNQFKMSVDVAKTALAYQLEETTDVHKGTRIEASLYEPLTLSQLELVRDGITRLIRFVSIPVYLNGKRVSKHPSTEEWDLETDEAYFRFDPKGHALDVYNAGVFVSGFGKWKFGCAGVIVTKDDATLQLNLARNDILLRECKVWPKIAKHFPSKVEAKKRDRDAEERRTPKALKDAAATVLESPEKFEDTLSTYSRLLVSVHGRALSTDEFHRVWNPLPVTQAPKGDRFGKVAQTEKRAIVIARESLENFGFTSVLELKALLLRYLKAIGVTDAEAQLNKREWSDDMHALLPDLASERSRVKASELTPRERGAREGFAKAAAYLRYPIYVLLKEMMGAKFEKPLTELFTGAVIGTSPTALAWLDNSGAFVIERKAAVRTAEATAPGDWLKRFSGLVRNALAEHVGGELADKVMLRLLLEFDSLGLCMMLSRRAYASRCRAHGLEVPKGLLSSLDEFYVVDEAADVLVAEPAAGAAAAPGAAPAVAGGASAPSTEPASEDADSEAGTASTSEGTAEGAEAPAQSEAGPEPEAAGDTAEVSVAMDEPARAAAAAPAEGTKLFLRAVPKARSTARSAAQRATEQGTLFA